jgi:hypothetical protein
MSAERKLIYVTTVLLVLAIVVTAFIWRASL